MQNAFESGDTPGDELPAPMHRHSVDWVGAIDPPMVFRPLFPGWVIGKTSDHQHLISSRGQEFAECDIVRRDARKLRCVVNSPDNDAHRVYSSGAGFVLVSS